MSFSFEVEPYVAFLLGLATAVVLLGLWRGLRFLLDLYATRKSFEIQHPSQTDPREPKALEAVEGCKSRLRWQKTPNPQWVTPLVDEIPKLVREIAQIYYPDADDPIRAPGLSQFTRAIQLTAGDISDFLQTRRAGRLVDVSATAAWKTWEIGQTVAENEHVRRLLTVYDYVRPVVQAIRYKSPITWTILAVSNLAVRTLQPAVIDIVAQRAIQLYSGRLTPEGSAASLDMNITPPATDEHDDEV